MTSKAWVMAAMLGMVAGCTAAGKTKESAPATGSMSVELERGRLTRAKVVALEGASGGKAVVLTGEDGRVEVTVPLQKGSYELVVYGLAPSLEEDAFYVSAGNQIDERRFITEVGKVLPCRPLRFLVGRDGPCSIELSFAEENVKLDRLVIRPVKP